MGIPHWVCGDMEENPDSYVIGPLPAYDSHDWVWDGNPYNPQYNSVVQPQGLYMDGILQLQLGTNILGTYCDITSDILNISYAHEGCRECEREEVEFHLNEEPHIGDQHPFLYYDMSILLVNNHGMALTYQLSSPDGTFVPSTFLVQPGQVVVYPQFFPNAGFTGGSTTVFVRILHNGMFFCELELEIDFPEPDPARAGIPPMELSLMPNPADHSVLISYDLQGEGPGSLTLYSLTGIALIEQYVHESNGQVSMELDRLASGTYIVVLRNATGERLQQVLIKK